MKKRGPVNRKDTARSRGKKTTRRGRRPAPPVIVMHHGRLLHARLIMRGRGTLPAVVRII